MGEDNKIATAGVTPAVKSGAGEIADFVRQARSVMPVGGGKPGRLILALDATLSRQPTWDLACRLQGEMFDAAGHAGRLHVQLVYFRGLGECRASRFVADTNALKDLMVRIECRGGHTQIAKILKHARKENERGKVNALVLIGDAMEENADELADIAGSLGLLGVPVFVFQEGRDATAERTFKEIARLSKGAWFRFDEGAAAMLAKLLSAVAVFATGGVDALEARGRPEDIVMLGHLRGGSKP
jgi:hypothetical protein